MNESSRCQYSLESILVRLVHENKCLDTSVSHNRNPN